MLRAPYISSPSSSRTLHLLYPTALFLNSMCHASKKGIIQLAAEFCTNLALVHYNLSKQHQSSGVELEGNHGLKSSSTELLLSISFLGFL